jgi:hypothetical protein
MLLKLGENCVLRQWFIKMKGTQGKNTRMKKAAGFSSSIHIQQDGVMVQNFAPRFEIGVCELILKSTLLLLP